ncbi:MAG: alcohol dehydrogenase catalytic domain-containing protein [Planctomycetia bacterium]|nr:alcohol dehydrogenase catalytic domain-containing protein [Planctomycetia bacterium]
MKLDDYKKVTGDFTVPETSKAWRLYSAGLENLRLEELPMPTPADDELLVRVDAVGVCASDCKMIAQGEVHTRIKGKDLATDPATPGHEVSLTVAGIGAAREGKYNIGERYTVQADIYYKGENIAYGYKLAGADQQYQTIGPIIHEHGYLLPIDASLGYSQAAVAEPWACVYYAYEKHRPTKSVLPGGTAWYIGAGPLGLMHVEKGIRDGAKRVLVSEMKVERLERVRNTLSEVAEQKGCELVLIDLNKDNIAAHLEKASADDILLLCPVAPAAEEAMGYLGRNAYFNVFAGFPGRDKAFVKVNLNDMHYGNWTFLATSGSPIESLQQSLREAAEGKIDPNNSVACIGGIDAVKDAIDATHKGTYPGRIVIYPQIEMPLTPVEDLAPGGRWTIEAEETLLAENL